MYFSGVGQFRDCSCDLVDRTYNAQGALKITGNQLEQGLHVLTSLGKLRRPPPLAFLVFSPSRIYHRASA